VPIPDPLRPVIADALTKIVAGDEESLRRDGILRNQGDLWLWVREYPAELVPQPAEIWTHRHSEAGELDDGSGWWVVLPMWTKEESPSDLSLEMTVLSTSQGLQAEVHNLHVM
jgi:hypothetical protein